MVSLNQVPRPFIVGVVVERNLAAAVRAVDSAFQTGADAVELNVASLTDATSVDKTFFSRWRRPV